MDEIVQRFSLISDTIDSDQQWEQCLAVADELLVVEFWRFKKKGWRITSTCYEKLNRLLAKLHARCADSATYADAFVRYTGLMGRTLQLWHIEPRQPLLKRLLLSWTKNISDNVEVHWMALRGAWDDFKNILNVIRDIGNMPIQLDLLEIVALYLYNLHKRHDVKTLCSDVPEFHWLLQRLHTINADMVDMEYRDILFELNYRQSPRNVISVRPTKAFLNKLSVEIRAPMCNGDSIGLTVDFNLGVRSISILCSNSTFCTSQSEQWMPCEFFHDAILSIRVFKRAKHETFELYLMLKTSQRLGSLQCTSLTILLSAANVNELQKNRVFELFSIMAIDCPDISVDRRDKRTRSHRDSTVLSKPTDQRNHAVRKTGSMESINQGKLSLKWGTRSSARLKSTTLSVANPESKQTSAPDEPIVGTNQDLASCLDRPTLVHKSIASGAAADAVEDMDAQLSQEIEQDVHVSAPKESPQRAIPQPFCSAKVVSTKPSGKGAKPERITLAKAKRTKDVIDPKPKRRGRPPKAKPLKPTTRYNAKFIDPFKRHLQKTTNVHIEDNNLVSFSYRRQRHTDLGTSTKEVSIQFCDNSENDIMAQDRTIRTNSKQLMATTSNKPTNNKKHKPKSFSRLLADSEISESEEILPVSKRMAAKRRSEANMTTGNGHGTMTLTDICRNADSHDYTPDADMHIDTPVGFTRPLPLTPVVDISNASVVDRSPLPVASCELSLPVEPMPLFGQFDCMQDDDDDVINATMETSAKPDVPFRSRIVTVRSECSDDTTSVFSTPTKTNRLMRSLNYRTGNKSNCFDTARSPCCDDTSVISMPTYEHRSMQPPNKPVSSKKKTSTKRNASKGSASIRSADPEETAHKPLNDEPTTSTANVSSSTRVANPVANLRVYQGNWLLRQFVDHNSGSLAPQATDVASLASSYAIRARVDSGDAPNWQSSSSIGTAAGDHVDASAVDEHPSQQPDNDPMPSGQPLSFVDVDGTQMIPPVPPKRRRLSAAIQPRLVQSSDQHQPVNTSAMCRLDDPVLVDSSVSQLTSQCASAMGQLLNQNIVSLEQQFKGQMDGYQRAMDHTLAVHSRNMQHTKQRLKLCDGRLRDLEATIGAERGEYRACMEQAEVDRIRFIEDLHGLKMQWQQLKATFDAVSRTVNTMADGVLKDLLTQFGQNVRRTAIRETSANVHTYLSKLNTGFD